MPRKTDILSIGHYCHDLLIGEGHGDTEALGGGVAYGSGVLRALDIDFKIASKVGGDFKYWDQCADRPVLAQGSKTTGFVDDYTGGERVATVSAICENIFERDLPVDEADVSIVCGVINEIPVETILAVARRSRAVVCDIQGLIRAVAPDGKLMHVPLSETPFGPIMDRFAAVKVSRSEAPYVDLENLRKKTLVILTEDDQGCTIYDARGERHFPTRRVEPVDPTGAGDCFLAGFAYGWLRGFALERCASFANHCGALAVQHVGPKCFDPFLMLGASKGE